MVFQVRILAPLVLTAMRHNSVKYLHHLIEAVKLSFTDTLWYCADTDHSDVPFQQLLSKDYAAQRRKCIDPDRLGPPRFG